MRSLLGSFRGAATQAATTAAAKSKPSAAQKTATTPAPKNYQLVSVNNRLKVRAYQGKLKNTFKRVGGLMNELDKELTEHARKTYNRPQWDDVKPGDAVEVLYKETGANTRSQMASGVCIGTRRLNSWNASVRVMSVLGPHPVEYHFPLYSPLVSHVRQVQERFVGGGVKKTRRAKLYYMRKRPAGEMRTPASDITKEEREKALIVARRVSAEAKMGKKEKAERDAKKRS